MRTELVSAANAMLEHSAPQNAAVHSSDDVSAPPRRTELVRVLHVINGEHYSGAERVQDLLAARLPEFGYEASFALLKPGRFPEARQYRESPIFELPMRGRFDFSSARRLAELIKRERYELVHAHSPRAAMIANLAFRRVPVPWIHHVHSPTSRDSTRWLGNRVNAFVERRSLRSAAALIAVSRSMGQYAESLALNKPIHVVPNGVPAVGPLEERPTPSTTWRLGMLALFRPRKGLENLLEALAVLRLRGLDVKLRAIGGFESEDYEHRVRRFAQELRLDEAVEWTGFTRDVPAQLRRIDLLALPSLFGEGLPMVVLEAMAAGVPVIATRVEGVEEAVRHGLDGLLVPPGDAIALADAVDEVISGRVDWQSLRTSAYRRHAEEFTDQHMARRVADVYNEVLSR
jgi:glycosyltransferase involved in cell wall biosynthesis